MLKLVEGSNYLANHGAPTATGRGTTQMYRSGLLLTFVYTLCRLSAGKLLHEVNSGISVHSSIVGYSPYTTEPGDVVDQPFDGVGELDAMARALYTRLRWFNSPELSDTSVEELLHFSNTVSAPCVNENGLKSPDRHSRKGLSQSPALECRAICWNTKLTRSIPARSIRQPRS